MPRKKSAEILDYESNKTIRNHMYFSMGAGFIPLPFADLIGVAATQLDMIRKLSKLYDNNFEEMQGKAVITALTGSTVARLGASAVKFVPGAGVLLGGVSMAMMAAASTYAIGEVVKKHFQSGGDFMDLDPEKMKKYYKTQFDKGKKIAREMKESGNAPEASNDINASSNGHSERDVVQKLEDLARLHKEGIITKTELEKAKKRILK